MINVIIICGGDSNEREISLICAVAIAEAIRRDGDIQPYCVEICKDGRWRYKDCKIAELGTNEGSVCELRFNGDLAWDDNCIKMDYAIPYIPGHPGETGHLTAMMELVNLPCFGCSAEVHQACFNKVTQKLWCEKLGIPQGEYMYVNDSGDDSMQKMKDFLKQHGDVIVKPARSGSSVGVSQVRNDAELVEAVKLAEVTDTCIVVEKTIQDFMEYMLSCVEIDGEVRILEPMSVHSEDGGVLTYHKKYLAKTGVIKNLECTLAPSTVATLKDYTRRVFHGMSLQNLSRIDYFVCENGDVLLMELNTFPGIIKDHSFLCMAMDKAGYTLADLFCPIIRKNVTK